LLCLDTGGRSLQIVEGSTNVDGERLRSRVVGPVDATPMQVALAWLLQRAPNILLIPGTSSVAHLRENLAAAELTLSSDSVAKLDRIASGA
jgi:aryl-alcohol dehydrogenase-like predicted oxidoreductase